MPRNARKAPGGLIYHVLNRAAGRLTRPADWTELVNRPQTSSEAEAVRQSITHSRPLGDAGWSERMEKRLGLGPLRPRGRPKKPREGEATRQ